MIGRKFIRNNGKSYKDVELHAVFGVADPAVAYVNGTPAHAFLLLLACRMPLSGFLSFSSLLLSELEEGY
jgi:hypothetical protein